MIAIKLSGEHPTLPLEEVKALHEAYGKSFKILAHSGALLLIDTPLGEDEFSRLAFSHEFYPVWKVTDIKKLDSVLLELGIKKAKSFCVRCTGFSHNPNEEKRVGEVIFENLRVPVDLRKPDVTVYVLKIGSKAVVSTEKIATDDFRKRNQNERPFHRPVALMPKMARLFVNLARLKTGDCVLDPFCGAGSILIEAAEMGIKPIGRDLDWKMIRGCKKNLEFYGLKADVAKGDATKIELKTEKGKPMIVDAIATDPPYARASKVFSEDLIGTYRDFIKSAFKALKPGGYLVAATPTTSKFPYQKSGFKLSGTYDIYVHASLTRRIYVLRKP